MDFTPKSEKELSEMNLWPVGTYTFQVIEEGKFYQNIFRTEDTTSKAGNPMMRLVLRVYNDEGKFITVMDHLLESAARKLKYAALACGLEEEYNRGRLLASDFIGKSGYLELKISKGQPDNNGGMYSDKNEVNTYVPEKGTVNIPVLPDDEIPF